MTTAVDTAREARRAELRHLYATWLHADVATLRRDRAAEFRKLLPGCSAGVAAILVVGAALFAPDWPSRWTDPLSLVRIAIAIAGTVWFARTFFVFKPDAADLELARQDTRLDTLVRRWADQVRPGATYEPFRTLDEEWSRVARIVDGNWPRASGVFSWDQAGIPVHAAEGSVFHYPSMKDGKVGDDASGEIRFRGWVGVATLPRVLKAAIRVRARGGEREVPCDDKRLQPVELAALSAAYDVRATDAAVAGRILERATPHLAAQARLGQRVHLGVAGHTVVVLLETSDSWSHRLHAKFDESHALALGETLDVLNDVIGAVGSAVDDEAGG